MNRCGWVKEDRLYIAYHDTEWGVPVYDDVSLFEMLILEGSQAGLNWLIILRRREAFRQAYDGFDPVKMAKWDDKKIEMLLQNPGIIRNRLKVEAARTNARAFLKVVAESGSFAAFIWSFVGGAPLYNSWQTMAEIPVSTPESAAMSKELIKRGFKFVGPTICYAFMQSVGMVNDHIVDCFRYQELRQKARLAKI